MFFLMWGTAFKSKDSTLKTQAFNRVELLSRVIKLNHLIDIFKNRASPCHNLFLKAKTNPR